MTEAEDVRPDRGQGSFRCLRPRPRAEVRLLCFPFAGGSAHAFREWPERIGPRAELWAAVLPGHVGRLNEEPADDLVTLARTLAADLPGVPGPLVLFGHSMGAWLALEVAMALEAAGDGPAALMVAGRSGPEFESAAEAPPFAHLREDAFLRELARRYGGLPAAALASPEIIDLFAPILRADVAMMERYRPPRLAGLTCPVLAIGGRDDPSTPARGLDAWRRTTSGPFSLRTVEGGHFALGPTALAVREWLAAMSFA